MNRTLPESESYKVHSWCPKCNSVMSTRIEAPVSFILERLKTENDRLREALAIYADLEYWGAVQGDDQEYLFRDAIGQKTYVQGKRARAALEGKE